MIGNDWDLALSDEFNKDYFLNIKDFIDADVFAAINAVEVEHLCLQHIGCVVVHLCAEEDDAVHHQA